MKSALLFACLLFGLAACGAEPKVFSFVGKYEAALRGKSGLQLEVEKNAGSYAVSFLAAHTDGTGAAPDGGGRGTINARGELEFTFEDSFGNQGRGVLKRTPKGFVVMIESTAVEEPRAIVHYGTRTLKRLAPERLRK